MHLAKLKMYWKPDPVDYQFQQCLVEDLDNIDLQIALFTNLDAHVFANDMDVCRLEFAPVTFEPTTIIDLSN